MPRAKKVAKVDVGWAIYNRAGKRISDVSSRTSILQSANWIFRPSNSGYTVARVTVAREEG